jgi:hypothetical protein
VITSLHHIVTSHRNIARHIATSTDAHITSLRLDISDRQM